MISLPVSFEHDRIHEEASDWLDNRDEWIERRAQEVEADEERDLSEVIADYCETVYIGTVSGLKLTHWSEYDRVIRRAMKTCPDLKAFVERACEAQALKEFNNK